MAASPKYKVFTAGGTYVAAIKHLEDAAAFVSFQGEGATVRNGHAKKRTIWTEGRESFSAGESYDSAAEIMRERIDAQHAATRAEREAWQGMTRTKTHVIEHTKHPDDPREIDKLFVIDIDPPCGHLLHIETDTGSDVPTAGDGYDCEKCGAAITVEQVDHETRIDR